MKKATMESAKENLLNISISPWLSTKNCIDPMMSMPKSEAIMSFAPTRMVEKVWAIASRHAIMRSLRKSLALYRQNNKAIACANR